jgi:glucose-6-phosphate dehydrogenase assembly protein OpcA
MPFGRRQQICCEQVEITATRESLRDVPAVLRGITVPDLPVVICCPSVELCKRPEVSSLLPLSDKLIVDSGSHGDSTAVLQYLNEIKRPKLLVADLTWGRLTPLREAIAQIFENPVCLREAYNLESVNIQYKGREEPVSVYYFAGWFMHVLGAGVHLNIAKGVGPAYADITRIDLVGPDAKASLDVADGTAIDVQIDGTTQRVVLPELSVADLLRNELSIVGRDPIFEDALGLANLMWGPK